MKRNKKKGGNVGFYTYQKSSIPQTAGICSDRQCPCDETVIPRGTGYLYISPQAVAYMKMKMSEVKPNFLYGPMPILVCRQGAELRGLDLETAAADAKRWWDTGAVPLRPTPAK